MSAVFFFATFAFSISEPNPPQVWRMYTNAATKKRVALALWEKVTRSWKGGTPALAAALLWKEEGKGEGDSVLLPSSAIDLQKMNARQPNTAGAIVEDDWQTIEKEYNK